MTSTVASGSTSESSSCESILEVVEATDKREVAELDLCNLFFFAAILVNKLCTALSVRDSAISKRLLPRCSPP